MSVDPRNHPSVARAPRLPGPVRLLVSLAGAVVLAILGLVTLGLVMRLARRSQRAAQRPGAIPGGRETPGVTGAQASAAADRKHEASRAVVLDAWPLALALSLALAGVALEKAPKVAVYIPANTPPWDDAVTLALQYADIPYKTVWDEEVLHGDLSKYDWLHLHHEDFTGQHGKFYTAYHNFPWYQEEEHVQQPMAAKLGFAKITQLKAAVALTINDWFGHGGGEVGDVSG